MLNSFQHLTTNVLLNAVTLKQVQGDEFRTIPINYFSYTGEEA